MTDRNCKIRFANNNFNTSDAVRTYSSQKSGFPISNTTTSNRAEYGKFAGNFTITSSNNKLYINDGSDKTITLTSASYTYSTLASHIQTQLNASSSNWTCTYDFAGSTFKFTINRSSGTKVLRLSQTANACWDTLGFLGVVDDSTGPFIADAQRNHTEEWILIDLGMAHEVGFAAILGEIDSPLGISSAATIKIQGNNVNLWTAPPIDQTLERSDVLACTFLDNNASMSYRYWRLLIRDRENPLGPEGLKVSNYWLSDCLTLTTSSIANGFSRGSVDESSVIVSESGAKYFNTRPKYFTLSGEISATVGDERRDLEQFFFTNSVTDPFYISIDPTLSVFAEQQEVTRFVYFDDMPSMTHIIRDYFSIGLSVSEVI